MDAGSCHVDKDEFTVCSWWGHVCITRQCIMMEYIRILFAPLPYGIGTKAGPHTSEFTWPSSLACWQLRNYLLPYSHQAVVGIIHWKRPRGFPWPSVWTTGHFCSTPRSRCWYKLKTTDMRYLFNFIPLHFTIITRIYPLNTFKRSCKKRSRWSQE